MLGTFEPVDEEVNEIHTSSWEKLGQVHQAHAQLQRKRSYRKDGVKVRMMAREPYELLPDYLPSSSMGMETLMKRPKVVLQDAKDADKWKAKVLRMLQTKFASIISKSSTDVDHTNLHTVDLEVSEGNPVFFKQYTIPLKYQNYIDEKTKRLEEAGLRRPDPISCHKWDVSYFMTLKKKITNFYVAYAAIYFNNTLTNECWI